MIDRQELFSFTLYLGCYFYYNRVSHNEVHFNYISDKNVLVNKYSILCSDLAYYAEYNTKCSQETLVSYKISNHLFTNL